MFRFIVVGPGGEVRKHYDAGKPGYIVYKCNIVVSGPTNDMIHVGKKTMSIPPKCLYCFEANLYKHWIDPADESRVHLSYGYIVPYSDLGWDVNSDQVRLSNKIWSIYMKKQMS